MTTGLQSSKLIKSGQIEAGFGAEQRPLVKAENVVSAIPANSGAPRLEARSAYQILKVALKGYCLDQNAAINALEDLSEQETVYALSGDVSMMLTGPLHDNRSGQGEASSADKVFSKKDIENAASFLSSVITPGAHGHICCTMLVFSNWSKRLRARMEIAENVEADPEGAKERASHVLNIKNQALAYTTSLGVYSRDPRRKDLFHASVGKKTNFFLRKSLAWFSLLQRVSYNASGVITSQRPGWATVVTNIARLTTKKMI